MKAAPYHSLQEVADDTTTSHRRQLAIGISRAVCLYAMPVCLNACACMSVCMCAVCVGTGQNLGSLIQSSVSGCASSSGCGLEFHWCIFFGTWWRKFTQFPVSLPGPWSEGAALLVFRCAASHKQESFEERAERKHTSSTDGPRGRIGNSPSRIGSAIYAKRPWTSSCRASPGTAFINTSKEPRPSVFRQLLLAL